jgi:RNA polymerase sigma-70 factor (ECF subfamily)
LISTPAQHTLGPMANEDEITGDAGFLDRLIGGDAAAFDDFVLQFQHKVVNICLRFLRNPEDAEDTAQEVFVEAYRALPGFRREAVLSTWIYRIAVSKSLDQLRKRKRKKRDDGARGTGGGAELDSVPAGPASNPDRLFEEHERVLALQRALDALPEKQRIAVTLSKYEGLGSQEIAAVLGTTTVAVDSLIYRAGENLRKILRRRFARQRPGGGT